MQHLSTKKNSSKALSDSDQELIWHPFQPLLYKNLLVEKAEGLKIFTKEKGILLDMVSSWWTNIHGHANSELSETLAQQSRSLEHIIFAGFTHEPAIQLARKLARLTTVENPKIFYSDNGSTSVEVALKLSLHYWFKKKGGKKRTIVALEGSYHGDTFGAMAVGGRGTFHVPYEDYLFEVKFLPFPSVENEEYCTKTALEIISTDEVACFIYEPLWQAAGGMRNYSAEVLNLLISLFQQQGVHCIADEVMTGFGRTGKMFASDYLKTNPDMMCLSKGITGGTLPLGVTLISDKIHSEFVTDSFHDSFLHGHSYTGNPMICAVANKSIEMLEREGIQNKLHNLYKWIGQLAEKLKKEVHIENVRSLGAVLAFDKKSQGPTSYFNENREAIYNFFIENGVLMRPLGNTLYLMPPYVVTKEEFSFAEEVIFKFIRK